MSSQEAAGVLSSKAEEYAVLALAISIFLVGLGLSAMEYLLLSIRCFVHKLKPTNGELIFLVSAFWSSICLFDLAFSTAIDGFISLVATADVVAKYNELRGQNYTLEKALAVNSAILLIYQIVTTWAIHLLLVTILDTVLPFILSLLRDCRGTFFGLFSRFVHRCIDLGVFAHDFIEKEGIKILVRRGWIGHRLQFMRTCSDICKFNRRYIVDGAKKGARYLAWNLTVSQDALQEVMEILQPIGDFGELGFHTSPNKVNFEAMGSGSTVNFMIEMEAYGLEGTRTDEHPDFAHVKVIGDASDESKI
ncbi:hypothetical protein OIDMADRAFT_179636 [Oidiodendron maius Zn]|uniref:Uncharacterized protein n=1 Tax=Oidiodendron maius (strain Zn) TaxID=913774 RepID=A0A0C3HGY1_OIDMZ|nr:hypothetical protein OIDMADRAFT_179636 [Oidiodendron maius Zn]